MSLILPISAALLPAIILGLYIWRMDAQPEPTRWLLRSVFAGIIICIPVAFAELYVKQWLFGADGEPTTLFGSTAMAFLVAAVPEESAKLLALWLILRRNPYFDEHFDGIVYAVFVGLGFAGIENVFYVVGQENWMSVALMRSLLAVPGHYAFAILMGYYYSVYHFVDHSCKSAICVLFWPVMAHGVYDSIAMSGSVNPIAGAISFFVLVYFCIKLQRFAKKKVQELANK